MFLLSFVIAFVFLMFLYFRNSYTAVRISEATDVIGRYNMNLVLTGQIDKNDSEKNVVMYQRNFRIMKASYFKYMFTFHVWGKYSAIMSEYKEALKPFMDDYNY